ncbi:hypothetical protein [Streptomyces iconiensis]|uniref:Lipoprotein n=1 Tax=Streptomyces iconiensis TaxID=1384038 RepID=A0ABT6ZRN9_9ACTN|nr:hypothetical protein [Streptomyces iconiensis]MDJ1131737.1 hypothetical protein [Streptomyces iconiensis]
MTRNSRRWSRALPVAAGAVVLAVALTGCDGKKGGDHKSDAGSGGSGGSGGTDEKKTSFQLGEASPTQTNDGAKAKGKWTVTPTKAETGTEKELAASGLDREDEKPEVPVFVWSTLRHQGGDPMTVRDMKTDINVKTDGGKRVGELIVLMGDAKWRDDCPAVDAEKKLKKGDVEKVCTVYLVPKGQKAAAVELSQGFHSPPLEWPVKN